MTDLQAELDQLKALEAKSTEGPWHVCDKDFNRSKSDCPHVLTELREGQPDEVAALGLSCISKDGRYQRFENAELIVAARNNLPKLIAKIEAVLALRMAHDYARSEQWNLSRSARRIGYLDALDDVRRVLTEAGN